MCLNWKLVETLFHEQTNDSVRVEDKVATAGVAVSDDGVETFELVGLLKKKDVVVF